MKTAVEWLIDEIDMQYPDINIKRKEWMIDKAKEMEEEQISKSFSDGAQWKLYGCDLTHEERSEEYYNEIFKQQDQ
jgi:hypothetical protein